MQLITQLKLLTLKLKLRRYKHQPKLLFKIVKQNNNIINVNIFNDIFEMDYGINTNNNYAVELNTTQLNYKKKEEI